MNTSVFISEESAHLRHIHQLEGSSGERSHITQRQL